MIRSLLFFLLFMPALSLAKLSSFTGPFVGGSVGFRHMNLKVNKETKKGVDKDYKFTGSGNVFEFFGGLGKAWKRLYIGYEGSVGYNNTRIKKDGASIGNNFQFGMAMRVGAPIPDAGVMPYFSLGLEYRGMDIKTDTTNNFYNYSLIPALGLEILVDSHWRIRTEAGYSFSIHTTNLPGDYKMKTKPSSFLFKAGAVYKFDSV